MVLDKRFERLLLVVLDAIVSLRGFTGGGIGVGGGLGRGVGLGSGTGLIVVGTGSGAVCNIIIIMGLWIGRLRYLFHLLVARHAVRICKAGSRNSS